MGSPYVGEIRIFAGNFAPAGWMFCDGSILAISENSTLFNLIGTTYGGDGQTTFALPDLRGRVPVHQGSGWVIGQMGGVETVTLTTAQLPAHSHAPQASSSNGDSSDPSGHVWARSPATRQYVADPPNAAMAAGALSEAGGSLPHDNMLPFVAVSFIISLFGIFPTST